MHKFPAEYDGVLVLNSIFVKKRKKRRLAYVGSCSTTW